MSGNILDAWRLTLPSNYTAPTAKAMQSKIGAFNTPYLSTNLIELYGGNPPPNSPKSLWGKHGPPADHSGSPAWPHATPAHAKLAQSQACALCILWLLFEGWTAVSTGPVCSGGLDPQRMSPIPCHLASPCFPCTGIPGGNYSIVEDPVYPALLGANVSLTQELQSMQSVLDATVNGAVPGGVADTA